MRAKMEEIEEYNVRMSNLCRQKLLGYAESFEEVARSFREQGEICEDDRQEFLQEMNLWEQRQIMKSNFQEMANIMSQLAEEIAKCRPLEEKKAKILIHAMKTEGVCLDNVYVLSDKSGKYILGMTMYSLKKGGKPAADIAKTFSSLLQRPLQISVSSPSWIDKKNRNFVMVEKVKYISMTGFCRAIRENETISGDNYSVLETEKGSITMLLSDGTGCGERANQNSGEVLDVMEKLLEAGYSIEAAAHIVNTMVLAKGEENNHPTLDACSIDLYEAECFFCKVGGAVSFLKRGEEVEIIRANNLPLGIFQQMQPHTVKRQLQDGDYIILMTDGVLDALQKNGYEHAMIKAIRELKEQSPREIAEKLLHFVLYCCEGHVLDDMTILVAGIWERSSIT